MFDFFKFIWPIYQLMMSFSYKSDSLVSCDAPHLCLSIVSWMNKKENYTKDNFIAVENLEHFCHVLNGLEIYLEIFGYEKHWF